MVYVDNLCNQPLGTCVCFVDGFCFCLDILVTHELSRLGTHITNTLSTLYIYIERISILFLISSIFFRSSVTVSTLFVIVLTA